MPVNALRSVADHFDAVLRHVKPKRIAAEMKVADNAFHFRHFRGYRVETIGRGRIKKIAKKEIFGGGDGHELFANLIIVHWNEGQRKLYGDMVRHVQTINEDVEAIEKIEDADAHRIIDAMLEDHTHVDILLCTRLNGVRFDEAVIASRLERGEPAPEGGTEAEGSEDAGEAPASDDTAEANAPAAQDAAADAPAAEADEDATDDAGDADDA